MAFEALRCHIAENILHYMRPIWLAEDPGQRLTRLSRELLGGVSDQPLIARLIEQPLLGFHLNCSVFPVRLGADLEKALRDSLSARAPASTLPAPEGPTTFAQMLAKSAKTLKGRIRDHFGRIADERFQADGRRLLEGAIRDAVRHALTCEPPKDASVNAPALAPAMLPGVVSAAGVRIEAALKAAAESPSIYLSDDEKQLSVEADTFLNHLSGGETDDRATADCLTQVRDAGLVADRILHDQDFKPTMVTLPDGGYYCEPVLGKCSAAEELRSRELVAGTGQTEAEARQATTEAERKERRLVEGNLEADPTAPTVRVVVENQGEA